MKTTIGFLRKGDQFTFDGKTYEVGRLLYNTNGYVACVNIESKRITRLHIDTTVEVGKGE